MSSYDQQQLHQYQQDPEYPLSSALRRQFDDLSKHRDTPSESVTEERFVPTEDGGYIHEVTSRTTPRRRPDTGEEISIVTQRRVSTLANPDVISSTPTSNLHLKYTSKSVSNVNSRSPSASTTGAANSSNHHQYQNSGVVVSPGPSSYNFNNNNNNNNSASSSRGGGGSGYQQQSSSTTNNNYQNQNQGRSISMNSTGSGHSTSNNTNWRYNPDQQQQQQQQQQQGNFQTQPVYQQEQMNHLVPPQNNRNSHNNIASPNRNVGFGQVNTQIVEPFRISPLNPERNYAPLKYVTRRQLREMQKRGTHRALPNRIRASSVPKLDEMIMEEQQEQYQHRVHSRGPHQRNAYDHNSEYPPEEDFGPRTFYDPDQPNTFQYQQQHRSASQHSGGRGSPSVNSGAGIRHYGSGSQMSIDRYRGMPQLDGDEMVERFADALGRIRGIEKMPSPPAYIGAAMRLLIRGTYLVHYGKNPHERYFMLRMINDDNGRPHPYFTWALHAESASYIERIHLAHLAGVGRGTSSSRFKRFQVDATHLRGPFVGDDNSIVGSKYAFSFVFQSRQSNRQVNVLALDDQTFRCWLLVCDYFADINSNAAADAEYEAETMAPDTPRSSVAP